MQDAKLDINEAKQIWINLNEEKEAADESVCIQEYIFILDPDPGERIQNLEAHAKKRLVAPKK